MALPSFVHVMQEPSPIYCVDIPADLDDLVAWMYLLAKKAQFPVQMEILGGRVSFGSLEEMLGFAIGVKRTSDVFRVAQPIAQ